jgi:glyoxylase-like metal-dependent hydrolase (beta-lactamase superfamily II)
MTQTTATILPIQLPLSNAYLVRGQHWFLIDTGAPGDASRILRAAHRQGIQPGDIAFILLTHGHVDHFGSAATLRQFTGAPIAVHQADLPYLEQGRNPEMAAVDLEGRLLRPFLPWSAPPLTPDIIFTDDIDLRAYGLEATVLPTPGHSPGSVALLLPDGALFAGDLLRGGYLGGRIMPRRPNPPFFATDLAQLWESLERVLTLPFTTMYVGHGGPLTAAAVRQRYGAAVRQT